jgi:hypothetical protein
MHTSLHHYTLTVERESVARQAKRNLGYRDRTSQRASIRDRMRATLRPAGGGLTPARV